MTHTETNQAIPVDGKASVSPVAGKPGGKPASLIIFVLLIGMAALAWFFWSQLQLQHRQLMEFERQVQIDQRAQDKLLQESIESQKTLKLLLDEQLALFDGKIEKLNNADRSDWLLAEAEYLLRLAGHYASLAQDARSADVLLANADQVMLELEKNHGSNKSLVEIRRLIAGERVALKSHTELDREGLYLELETFIQQTDALSVVDISSMAKRDTATEVPASHDNSASGRIFASLKHALEKTGGYIRIRQHSQDIGPLLSSDEQQYLKQNLRFRLEQAQIALLQGHQAVYASSLANARQWIKQYYLIDPVVKNALLQQLDSFSAFNVEEPLPDISGSLAALKKYMQASHTPSRK